MVRKIAVKPRPSPTATSDLATTIATKLSLNLNEKVEGWERRKRGGRKLGRGKNKKQKMYSIYPMPIIYMIVIPLVTGVLS